MFEIKTYPEFSWSLSRHKTLTHCARQYAHQYYTAHNGWLRQASETSKHAYRLKNITNLEMYFGSAVHALIDNIIENYLDTGYIPSENELTEKIRADLNQGFIEAIKYGDKWFQKPNKSTMLHELYYGNTKKLPADKIAKIKERLQVTMPHFLKSKTLNEFAYNDKVEFLEAEKFRILHIGNVKVYVVLDLLYRDLNRDKWVIVDWKTGKQTAEDPYQLALYALYLLQSYPIPSYTDIVIRNEYLVEGTSIEHQLDPVALEKVQELIGSSVEWMNEYVEDVPSNQPLPLESFPKREDQRACHFCNFYELCFPS
ncbi:PD-(D/E)XK nuclease family protein [Bacillus piscicola]|uniref:PD-(D/E)XK nuclease family protein n=1 Tax=Bacillus piscicola TaxID=1632684 RepID=UPI001F092901|nr:PD-(D/E)XK nuclease family protein [Bacillus piscicola]